MTVLSDARDELRAVLEAVGLEVRDTPSVGHINPPAALIGPGSEWIIANTQLGTQLHGRLQLSVTFLAGHIAAGASLAALEAIIEDALPALVPKAWTLSTIAAPFGLTIAGTEYLAASATITRSLILS